MKREFTKEDTLVVKGLAILCLLFYHLFEHYERVTMMGVDYRPFSIDTFLLISGFGNICVAVFAFLSAYGITKGIMSMDLKGESGNSIKSLYKKACGRYIKLTANFVVMFAGVNILWFTKFNYSKLYGTGWQAMLYGFLDATGLAGMFKTPTINETWWYMELAVLIIFVVPIIFAVAKRMGNYAIIPAVLLPVAVDLTFDIKRYYFVIVLGVLAAAGQWFEKLFEIKIPMIIQAVAGVVLLIGFAIFRQNYVVYNEFAYLVDAPIALFVSWFGARIMSCIPGVNRGLGILGKHSMNIYFVHTFFYMAIYQEFIYSFKYAGIIFIVLVAVSLGYSLVLEGLKKITGFNKFVKWLVDKTGEE